MTGQTVRQRVESMPAGASPREAFTSDLASTVPRSGAGTTRAGGIAVREAPRIDAETNLGQIQRAGTPDEDGPAHTRISVRTAQPLGESPIAIPVLFELL